MKKETGMAGFEPTNARVKVWCLTAWRHPNVEVEPFVSDTLGIIARLSRFGNPFFANFAVDSKKLRWDLLDIYKRNW